MLRRPLCETERCSDEDFKDGARLNVNTTGWGDPTFLFHCSASSGSQWRGLSKGFGGKFCAIAPDQWACGGSDKWPGTGAFSLAEEAAPMIDIIDHLDAPIHLVGHSYGGGLALHIARVRPQIVRSLTLIEPSSFHLLRRGDAGDRTLFGEISRIADAVREAIAQSEHHAGMARFLNYWNGAGTWAAMSVRARDKAAKGLEKVAFDFQALIEEPVGLPAFTRLSHPTLILCGENSPAPSKHIVEMLGAAMPNARIERIAGANHMSPITHPKEVNRAISAHLQRYRTEPIPLVA